MSVAQRKSLRSLLEDRTARAADSLVIKESDGAVRCLACGHRCLIREGKSGVCQVRHNRGGELRVPHGYVAGLQIDPIEKKPFFHAYPGRDALSFGMLGCDLHCGYCQNWVTSQALRDDEAISQPRDCTPEQLVNMAVREDVPVIVSTYNEPLITADWAVKIFEKACDAELVCGFVSNGNATPEVLAFLRPFVRLYKVDLKTFDDGNYRKLGGVLSNVLRTIEDLYAEGFWVEIVTLVVPGFNDSDDELNSMARFLKGISPDIPWHVTAFHPDYKMTGPSRTSVDALVKAYDIGKDAGLRYIYPGNIPGALGDREHTFCPDCGECLIARKGFRVLLNTMKDDSCPQCGAMIPGVWESSPPSASQGTGFPRPISL